MLTFDQLDLPDHTPGICQDHLGEVLAGMSRRFARLLDAAGSLHRQVQKDIKACGVDEDVIDELSARLPQLRARSASRLCRGTSAVQSRD